MDSRSILRRVLPAIVVGTLLAGSTDLAARSGGARPASRSANSGGAARPASPGGHAAVPRSTGARPAGPPTTAHGRATYGHYGGAYYYPPGGWWGSGWGYYPWWGSCGYYGCSSWSLGFWWGSPWESWWPYYPYSPGPYAYPYHPSESDLAGMPARVETVIRPGRAEVSIDGEVVGFAKDYDGRWDRLVVPPGLHKVEFSAPGHMTLTTWLDARPGAAYRLDHMLQKGEGADPRSEQEPPPTNSHHASASAGQDATASGSLKTGRLRIAVSPPDAAVYLDGAFLARGDELAGLHGAIPLASGSHLVEVVRPGFQTSTREVVVNEGTTVDLAMDLPRQP